MEQHYWFSNNNMLSWAPWGEASLTCTDWEKNSKIANMGLVQLRNQEKGPNWIFKPDAFFSGLKKTFPRFEKRGCSALFYFFPFFLFDLKWTREWRSWGWNGGFMIRIWLLLKTCFVPFSTHIQKIIFFAAFSGCERPLRSRLASLSYFSSFSTNEAILSYLKAFVSIVFNRVMMVDEAQ